MPLDGEREVASIHGTLGLSRPVGRGLKRQEAISRGGAIGIELGKVYLRKGRGRPRGRAGVELCESLSLVVRIELRDGLLSTVVSPSPKRGRRCREGE